MGNGALRPLLEHLPAPDADATPREAADDRVAALELGESIDVLTKLTAALASPREKLAACQDADAARQLVERAHVMIRAGLRASAARSPDAMAGMTGPAIMDATLGGSPSPLEPAGYELTPRVPPLAIPLVPPLIPPSST